MTEIAPRSDTFDLTGLPTQDDEAEQMVEWTPNLSKRQLDVYFNRTRILLVDGPRFSGKSIALAHKCIKRAWELYSATVGIFVSSYKVATDSGSWADVTSALKAWAEAGIESEYGYEFKVLSVQANGDPGAKVDAKNRTPYIQIQNKWGTVSTIRLFSISNENEIEKKVKSTRFAFAWCVELSNFKNREIIDLIEDQLRADPEQADTSKPWCMKDDDFQLVCDTNPPKEGKKHFIYKWFYLRSHDDVRPELQEKADKFTACTGVETLYLDDNPWLSQDKKDRLHGKYASDPNAYQRFVLGEYPDAGDMTTALFADVFSPELIVEDAIDVDDLTDTLYGGFDPGYVNHAWCLLEKRIVAGQYVWCVLDEIVHLGSYVSVQEFALEVLERMIKINDFYRKKRVNFQGFKYVNWSDSSCFIPNMNDEGGTQAVEIHNVTSGQIELQPVSKPAKSVESSCQMIRKLMRERRFFVGRNCPNVIDMVENIRRPSKGNSTIDVSDKRKHCADALRYPIFSESEDDLMSDPLGVKQRDNRTIRVQM